MKLRSYWLPRFIIAEANKSVQKSYLFYIATSSTLRTSESSVLPPLGNDQGVTYNRTRCKPVFKSSGKSAGCFDLSIMTSDDITDEASSHDPFYIGMMTNKNAGNPFHKYLVRYV